MSKKSVIGPVPSNTAEASEQLARIGALERAYRASEADMNEVIARIKASYAPELERLAESTEREIAGLQVFAEANRATLLPKDAKSVALAAGRIGWRFTPYRVVAPKKGGEKKLLEILKSLRLDRFIRTTEAPDKEALLSEKPELPGVKYARKEEFFVEPNATQATVALGEVLVTAMR